jgi:predicted heme/steroid binding protein
MRKLKMKKISTANVREFAGESMIRLFNTAAQLGLFPQRPMTIEDLALLDGRGGGTLCFGCRGRVFDATDSEMFRSAYQTWAGRDATFALATMSLDENDAGRTDRWIDPQLSAQELECVTSWERYFAEKYWQRGRLLEYDQDHEEHYRLEFVRVMAERLAARRAPDS